MVLRQDLYLPDGTGTGFVLIKLFWERICIGSGCNWTDLHGLQDKVAPGKDVLHLHMFGRASSYPGSPIFLFGHLPSILCIVTNSLVK